MTDHNTGNTTIFLNSAVTGVAKKLLFVAGLLFIFGTRGAVAQQTEQPITITRISGQIQLDGLSNEAAWEKVEPFPMVMYEPVFGREPTERTVALVAYDDEYMYFALRAYDSESDKIRGNILTRDRFGGDDYFEVMIDTYNDNENSMVFNTNPAGNRRDVAISRDASGPFSSWLNQDFNTFWDAATTVNDEGWFAEIRIPFSSLRFQDENGRVVMGLSLHRIIVRKSERAVFPAIEPTTDLAYLKPSRMQKVVLVGVESERPVYIRPYGLAGLERAAVLPENETEYSHDYDHTLDAGVDVKYGLSNSLTLDLTLNTDFAQVEVDEQQVNLTRFSLFFPEKRQFFQERAGLFEFRTGGLSRLFHSRRIGLTRDGEMVRILGGARVVGRTGPWDIGILNMQTQKHDPLPSENFGAVRLRRQVFNPYSYLGGMVTSRIGLDGRYNLAYGLDGSFRLYGDDYLTFQWANTFDKGPNPGDEAVGSPAESGRFSGIFEKRRSDGFGYSTEFTWSGPEYNPEMGFVRRVDFTRVGQDLSYSWWPGDASPLRLHTVLAGGEMYLRNADGSVESFQAGPEWSFILKSGGQGSVSAQVHYEDIRNSFSLDEDTFIPVGSYIFYTASANYMMSRSGLFQLSANVEAGSFYGGERYSLGLNPTWNVSQHLELQGSWSYNHIRFPERGQQFDSHLGQLRIRVPFNTSISTNLFLQYNSVTGSFSTNARFRYNFSEGHDLWIVYNENLNTDRSRIPGIELPGSQFRTFMVKYTYTFIL